MTQNGVAKTCAELGIPTIAYSPHERGFLTGQIQRADELLEGDVRKPFPRIQPRNFEKNMELVKEVERIAQEKGCLIGQIALAWVKHHSGKPDFPDIITIPGATTSARIEENTKSVALTDLEYQELNVAVEKFEIVGKRYQRSVSRAQFTRVGEATQQIVLSPDFVNVLKPQDKDLVKLESHVLTVGKNMDSPLMVGVNSSRSNLLDAVPSNDQHITDLPG